MNKILNQITIVVSLIIAIINGQEINKCIVTRTNQPGVCKLITDCKSVQDDMITRRRQPTICGYDNLLPIVCCPIPKIPKTTKQPEVEPTTSMNPLSKSETKCIEYSKSVYTNQTTTDSSNQTIFEMKDECTSTSLDLIAGGDPARPKEFPHMALLGFEELNKSVSWSCGGSLISELYVLTAGHCLKSQNGPIKFVRLGDLIIDTDFDDAKPKEYEIIEIIENPKYSRASKYHDIALLKLNETVIFNAYIRPLCLPSAQLDGERLIATGWGRTGWADEVSPKLLKVFLEPFSNEECNNYYANDVNRKLENGIDDKTQLCVGSRIENKDTCPGDSGGPLQSYHKTEYCMFTIQAITSFGKICGFQNAPGVYTRVLPYVEWIESIVWP